MQGLLQLCVEIEIPETALANGFWVGVMLGHLCVLHTRFKFCSGQELPLAATGLFDMFTIVLAGKNKPTASRLQRLLGARKHMVRDFIKYMQDKDISLVNGFCLAGKASVSETSLDRYPSDGSVLQDLLDAVFNPQDPSNLRGRSSSSYTNERRESEVMDEDEVSSDMESAGGSDSENDVGEDGRAYIIVANGVVDSVQDTVTSSLQRPSALRNF